MNNDFTPTHEGWFGICPILASGVDTEAPWVKPRYKRMGWLLGLSEGLYGLAFYICGAVNPEFEPSWPLRVREIRNP